MQKTIEFDKIPGSKKLFLDFLSGKTAEFYRYHFGEEDSLRQVNTKLRQRTFPREEVVAALLRQNSTYGAGPKTIDNIKKLLDSRTSAVFTGQQVVIFGGPLFVFYKAALAVKLAESNCRKLDAPVVPIFWLAADDADFAEVATVTIPSKNEQVFDLIYTPQSPIERQPMGSVRFDKQIVALIDQYEQALPETEFRAELITRLREFYRPGETIVTAFAKYLSFLFRDKGLILIDPSDEEFRRLSLPVFKKELELRERGARLVEKNNSELEGEGYHLQVAKPGGYANLFYYNGKRTRIDFADGGFGIDGKYFSQSELTAILEKSPTIFSPNVFLRPIVQSHLFPTLIYFAGPAEAAYFSQIKELFDLFGEVEPIIYPRFSATIIERNVARLMEKYELSYEDFSGDLAQLTNSVLQRTFPSGFEEEFGSLKHEVQRRMQDITALLDQSDHGLLTNAARIAGRIENEITNLEDKVFQAHKKKNQTILAQLERIAFNLFPARKMQERVYPMNYFIAKYGNWIIDRLYDSIDCNSKVHHLIYLDEGSGENS